MESSGWVCWKLSVLELSCRDLEIGKINNFVNWLIQIEKLYRCTCAFLTNLSAWVGSAELGIIAYASHRTTPIRSQHPTKNCRSTEYTFLALCGQFEFPTIWAQSCPTSWNEHWIKLLDAHLWCTIRCTNTLFSSFDSNIPASGQFVFVYVYVHAAVPPTNGGYSCMYMHTYVHSICILKCTYHCGWPETMIIEHGLDVKVVNYMVGGLSTMCLGVNYNMLCRLITTCLVGKLQHVGSVNYNMFGRLTATC